MEATPYDTFRYVVAALLEPQRDPRDRMFRRFERKEDHLHVIAGLLPLGIIRAYPRPASVVSNANVSLAFT